MTALGSSYYHLNPDNKTLFWDRLPMTIVFISFFSAIICEYLNQDTGRKILLPFLIFGLISVVYWHVTEEMGMGDLRLYILVQFLPMILIPLIITIYKPMNTQKRFVILGLVFYCLSKISELLDVFIFQCSENIISGHSAKHVLAALGAFFIMKMFCNCSRLKMPLFSNWTLDKILHD